MVISHLGCCKEFHSLTYQRIFLYFASQVSIQLRMFFVFCSSHPGKKRNPGTKIDIWKISELTLFYCIKWLHMSYILLFQCGLEELNPPNRSVPTMSGVISRVIQLLESLLSTHVQKAEFHCPRSEAGYLSPCFDSVVFQ